MVQLTISLPPQLAITGMGTLAWALVHAYSTWTKYCALSGFSEGELGVYLIFVTIPKQFFFYWLDFCSTNDQSIENNKSNYCPFWPNYLLLFSFLKNLQSEFISQQTKSSRECCTWLLLEFLIMHETEMQLTGLASKLWNFKNVSAKWKRAVVVKGDLDTVLPYFFCSPFLSKVTALRTF